MFPSPTGVTYYEFNFDWILEATEENKFPSPTGVTYYESEQKMMLFIDLVFPSPTGVTYYEYFSVNKRSNEIEICGFRPQQGLLIMNRETLNNGFDLMFPSPTGVTYYE